MEGIRTVHSAVYKASRVSKRSGKWSNLQEIKMKIPHENTFKQPVRPLLNTLVRTSDIEKKSQFSLWRPSKVLAAGGGGSSGVQGGRSSPKTSDRRSSPKTGGRRSSPKQGSRRSSPKTSGRRSGRKTDGRRTLASGMTVGIAGSAVGRSTGSSVGSSVGRSVGHSVSNSISNIMF